MNCPTARNVRTVEVYGARSIGINLSDYTVEIRAGELVVESGEDLLQCSRGDVSVPFAIVQAEGLLQLFLHRLGVLLFQESAGDLAETVEVHFPSAFGVGLLDHSVQLRVVEQLAHGVQYRRDLQGVDEAALRRVEHLERFPHHSGLLLVFLLQTYNPICTTDILLLGTIVTTQARRGPRVLGSPRAPIWTFLSLNQ